MKTATYNGKTIQAKEDAPEKACCPACGWPVILTHSYDWHYRHQQSASGSYPDNCPRGKSDVKHGESPTGEYALALDVLRRTLIDALNGYGDEALAGLFSPPVQVAIEILMDANGHGEAIARRLARRIMTMPDEKREKIHHALTWKSLRQMREVFSE
jgi:hypothetical protein